MNERVMLVPLDGSTVAEAALPYAQAIARAYGASVRLLHAVGDGGVAEASVAARIEPVSRAGGAQYLERIVGLLTNHGLTATPLVIGGAAADTIVAAAHDPAVMMTVMATHGRGGVERLIVGSVADKVMRLSGRPTLLVRAPDDPAAAGHPVRLHRLLVPLDGSDLAETAVEPAVALAQATGAEVLLVRVEPWLAALMPEYGVVPDLNELEAEVEQGAHAYLEGVRRRLPAELPVTTAVYRGAPALTLIDVVEERAADLVVMSPHGRSGLRRLMLGSTADRIVRAGIPALLIRPDEHAAHAPAGASAVATSSAPPGR